MSAGQATASGAAPSLHAHTLTDEDQTRADFYALIATLLLQAPAPDLLGSLAACGALPSDDPEAPLCQSWQALVDAAGRTDAARVREEFDALFTGIGTPLLNPYGSHYLVGFMMDQPLANLREDLAGLKLARRQGAGEPEDHLGALCEVMRLLIVTQSARAQKAFFMRHIVPWYSLCLEDIQNAQGADFYRHVAQFCRAFLEVEFQAFEMDDGCDDEHPAAPMILEENIDE